MTDSFAEYLHSIDHWLSAFFCQNLCLTISSLHFIGSQVHLQQETILILISISLNHFAKFTLSSNGQRFLTGWQWMVLTAPGNLALITGSILQWHLSVQFRTVFGLTVLFLIPIQYSNHEFTFIASGKPMLLCASLNCASAIHYLKSWNFGNTFWTRFPYLFVYLPMYKPSSLWLNPVPRSLSLRFLPLSISSFKKKWASILNILLYHNKTQM